jgi:hypothetical protein
MKLYNYFRSSASYRVRIVAGLKGLSPEYASINLTRGESRTPAYEALNPQGKNASVVGAWGSGFARRNHWARIRFGTIKSGQSAVRWLKETNMKSDPLLPQGFESAERYLRGWVLPDSAARSMKRQTSTMEEIRAFYDTMLPIAGAAADYLREYNLGSLPPEGERLLKLMLSLAEIAPAVEWYNAPKVYDGFDIGRVRLVAQLSDTGAQT